MAIAYTDNVRSAELATELQNDFIQAILLVSPNFREIAPPCSGGHNDLYHCVALDIADNEKLLLIVSDSQHDQFNVPGLANWPYAILPVLPADVKVILPTPLNVPQAAFWSYRIADVIPVLFGISGISDSDRRVFISYRRTDTEALAEQLFDKLHHAGFEVFLDRFSIDPGVNFQSRLYQELADKAMVVFLESPNFLKSDWVQLEIDFVKKYRLGYLAINLLNAPKTSSVDQEYRRMINAADLDATGEILNANTLDTLIRDIQSQHAISLYRMKNNLDVSIIAALKAKGLNPHPDASGLIRVIDTGLQVHKIWSRARPAILDDYHLTDTLKSIGEQGIVVSPDFPEIRRLNLNSWLARKAHVLFFNEGQILELADHLS
jgi:hypothetical protein